MTGPTSTSASRDAAAQVSSAVEPDEVALIVEPTGGDPLLLAAIRAARETRAALAARKPSAPSPEDPQKAGEGPRAPRVRRPGSKPFTVTTGAPGGRPDAWRPLARPEPRANDDEPPDE